ncbi:30S ribosomal protein S3 [Candidatus Hodgkinia cicadicola]|uniref:30S ribosomal protein S3 n=1 Tax=Candidatus Hodgkinia cicadicola TaxID=573658 RepID=A0ABX4MG74_9HYPH|nr:30S ribosomal protein S3 [Candidatus Hodgkinia cicadicola]PIM96120.1 30S ribosomal protein S3 [Candidatus Hodgkinia cicadicola]
MGKKANPIGIRLSLTSNWEDSVFFMSKDYSEYLSISYKLKTYLINRYKKHGLIRISVKQEKYFYRIILETDDTTSFLYAIKHHVNDLNIMLKKLFWSDIKVFVKQIDNPAYHPLVIANKLINETSDITIMANVKQISKSLVGTSIAGLKVRYSGRINRTDVAQTVWHIEGKMPLQTFSANILYTNVNVRTNYGICSIKVWVYVNNFK